ncbi:zinc finger BED domain-containing protein 4-like [Anastrepha ludens]|uniref:zinc finger BED domain-containing protein 4-like n=1 Tax=Anastrepha ludens TaxID=28586 RepID=UPI0023AF4C4B|nr:zinc finger BED domain-containing protein 4-like [Anastrepha ludens]
MNTTTMLKAWEILKIQNLPCFAHTVNLVVQDGLNLNHNDVTKALFAKCKNIVIFFKKSSIANEKLKQVQENFACTLLQEAQTRWNSFHDMIERVLLTHEAIASVLLSTTNAPLPFSAEEINVLKDIDKILALFKNVSEKVSGGKYVTVSLIIPLAYGLYRQIGNFSSQLATAVGKSMKDVMLESIKKRLSIYELRTVTRMATILDPRFKKDGFQSNANAEQMNLGNLTYVEDPVSLEASTTTTDPIFDFLNQRCATKKSNVRSDAIIIKRQYLERDIAPQEMDHLLWIKVNQVDFPLLKLLMYKYLCIPATSVESERLSARRDKLFLIGEHGLKKKM